MRNKNHILLLAFCGIAACKVPQVASLPEAKPLPAQYVLSDTLTAPGRKPETRDVFFTDTTLQRLIAHVLQNNPDRHMALQRMNSTRAMLNMRKAAFLPEVRALAQASGTRFGKYTMEGVGNFDTNLSGNIEEDQKVNVSPVPDYWLGLSTSWEADLWGKLKQMKIAAQNTYWASEEGRRWLTAQLVAQTAGLYYELIAADKRVAILEENAALQEKALEIIRAQQEVGRATRLALIQFEAQVMNTRGEVYTNEQQRAELVGQLHYLAGDYDGAIQRSKDFPVTALQSRLRTGIPADLLQNRPDVKESGFHLAAARADAHAARAAFFPSLNISAYTAFNAFSGNVLFSASSIGYQLLGGITAPIFNKKEIRTRFKVANAQQEEAFYAFQKTCLNAYREAFISMKAMQNNGKLVEVKHAQVASLREGIDVANDLYLNGYASYLEIITAQRTMLEAQLQLVLAQQEMTKAMISLYKATGGGWE